MTGGAGGNRTPDKGFADPCLTTWRLRHACGMTYTSYCSYTPLLSNITACTTELADEAVLRRLERFFDLLFGDEF